MSSRTGGGRCSISWLNAPAGCSSKRPQTWTPTSAKSASHGTLNLPPSGVVYLDANCVIYAVEKVAPYDTALAPLWQAAASGQFSVISSELVVLETLVKPLRDTNARLEAAFRAFLFDSTEFHLAPVEWRILERAARLRAELALKTPDAIHAATALDAAAALFITNDPCFRRVPGLPVAVLSETITVPSG